MIPLLVIVFGVIQYSLYFWAAQGGSTATREAARRAAVGDLTTCSAFTNYVQNRIGSFGNESTLDVVRSYAKGPGNSGAGVEVGDVVTVRVSFDSVDFNFPFVPFINGGRVSESADSRVENVPTAPEACS
jgi:Flp pilus assembly protein TadG